MSSKIDLIDQWIKKAGNDLGVASLSLENNAEFTDAICFHCQQASEKYLKAYIINLEQDIKKSHSLIYLLDCISEKDKVDDIIYDIAEQLEDYSVQIRYPDDWYEPSLEEAKTAYTNAKKIEKYVFDKLPSNHKRSCD